MINFTLITKYFEGMELVAYVPAPDGGDIESGVTVAGGLDLGQHSMDEIDDAFDTVLADKLVPYCGYTGHLAVELLKDRPLILSEAEAEKVNRFAHNRAVEKLLDVWQKYTDQDFSSLPDPMQTVIASKAFQYGYLPSRCKNFWRQAVANDWEGMQNNLNNFGDAYPSRCDAERGILLWGICQLNK